MESRRELSPKARRSMVRVVRDVLALVLLALAIPRRASAQIAVGSSASAGTSSTSLTFSHTVASGTGRLLLVGVAIKDLIAVSSVTYGGVALTRANFAESSGNPVRAELWYLVAPTVGTANVVVTMAATADFNAGATNYTGVDQTTPIRRTATGSGTGDPSVTIASQANDVVVDIAADKAVSSWSVGAGQTERWGRSNGSGGSNSFGGSSTEAGAASVTMSWTTSGSGAGDWAGVAASLAPGATTTLGNGTDPTNASLGPGGAATMADAFTFQTSSGTDAITAVTVTLATGTSGGLSLVEITNDAGTVVYGSVSNPASDTPAITLSTNITATTTSTQYKIRVTPKSHAAMPAPAGSSYAVTARISAWTGSNTQAGSDAAGTTVTIDNLSPGDVTAGNAIAGNALVMLDWTNPADADLATIVVLRRAGSAVADTPTEGATYAVGATLGASTVACVVTAPTASCTDTGLSNSTTYHYRIFTRDSNGNYSTGVVPTGSPAAPGQQTISSAANQTFVVGNPSTTASTITVTDLAGKFKAGSDIYFVIPGALAMVWDNAIGSITVTGNAAAKVSTTPSYSSSSCVKITVLSNFTANDQVIIAGLAFKSFTAAGGPAKLSLGLKACNALVATDDKSKTIVPPPNLSGNVFEDANYGGGAGRSRAVASGVGRGGARVELYSSSGSFATFTTTDASGNWTLSGLTSGTYYVRVVNASVTSSRSGYTAAALAVQTYRTDASSGAATAVTNWVGGTNPTAADPGNGSAGATFNTSTFAYTAGLSGTAQSVTTVTVVASDVTGIDFGFSFDVVVNTNDSGQGSLRQFLTNANTLGGDASLAQSGLVAAKENAVFMIPNGTSAAGLRAANNAFSGGVASIALTSALPTVSSVVVLDAQKQPGWTSAPIVELNGTSAGASTSALTLTAGSSVVRGLVINRFTASGIVLSTAGGNTVAGCYIGTNAAGTSASANASLGVYVNNVASNTIGGTASTDRNVISGNAGAGIVVYGASASSNTIQGNYIGTNAAGTGAIGNGTYGILVEGASGTMVGGTASGTENVIANNGSDGVAVVSTASGSAILRNAIYANGGLGIDLSDNGVTANNGTKSGAQPNQEMDSPIFTTASLSGTTLTLAGYVGSAAGQAAFGGARVELFKSSVDASGYGEGQVYLGVLTANASGNFSGTLTVSGLSVGDQVTATATDGSNNTSEFGANLTVLGPPPSIALTVAVSPGGTVLHGTDLAYTLTFSNTGGSSAANVVLVDSLKTNVDFKLGSVTTNPGTSGLTATVSYSNDGGLTWSYVPASGAGGAPAGYDRVVTHVRWTFSGMLSQSPPNNAVSVGVVARIR